MAHKIKPSKWVNSIKELKSDELVLKVGRLRAEYVEGIVKLGRGNLEVVLTGERRKHYLNSHPEMIQYEDKLADVVLAPNQTHRNRKVLQTVIFYKRLDQRHFLRAAIVLQPKAGELKHSIFSFRLAKHSEVETSAHEGRLIWRKK
ncbi:hypothetical protein FBQ82_18335 [Anaerolineae bacterium CFX7]|nr:hypothetical protein [Anaerolineae bacterium CFX7]